jgi:hypothetical protein
MGAIRPVTTAILLLVALITQQDTATLENLPTGEYRYERIAGAGRGRPAYVLLRKVGTTVIGLDARSLREQACFRGFIQDNQIVTATRIFPPYQPDSRWEHIEGLMVDLEQYQRVDREDSEADRAALQTCIEFFWR